MSIKVKLFLLVLIILVALIFAQERVRQAIHQKRSIEKVHTQSLVTEKVSNLIHALQKERFLSRVYVSFQHKKDRQRLAAQIKLTQIAIVELEAISAKFDYFPTPLAQLKAHIYTVRKDVEEISVSPDEAARFYIQIIAEFLQDIRIITSEVEEHDVRNNLLGYAHLMTAQENLSRIRVFVNRALINKEWVSNDYARFGAEKKQYEFQEKQFLLMAPDTIVDYYIANFTAQAVEETMYFMDRAYENPDLFNEMTPDTAFWMENSTSAINLLRGVEDYYLESIISHISSLHRKFDIQAKGFIILSVVLLLGSFFSSLYIVTRIASSLEKIKNAANKMATGNTDVSINITNKDEIGELALSIESLIKNTEELSKAAEEIGKGKYDVKVNIRSEKDTLGNSLEKMRVNLKQFSKDNKERTWLLKGNAELNMKMRGEMSVPELTNVVITHLAEYLNMQIGAIYLLADDMALRLVAAYAYDNEHFRRKTIELGEGLAGQAAQEKKEIIFKQVPENYLSINSALGEINPRNIIEWPLIFEDKVKGIIELGSVNDITNLQTEYLHFISKNITNAIHSSQTREELKLSLEKSRHLSENLKKQQSDLKNVNKQLLLQKNKLQESEEKLKSSNADLDSFAYSISHDLNEPLRMIKSFSDLLIRRYKGELDKGAEDYFHFIIDGTERMSKMINDLLEFSRVQTRAKPFQQVDLNQVIENVKTNLTVAIEESGAEITTKKLPVIQADASQMTQMFQNLISNSIKFRKKDEKPRIQLDFKEEKNHWIFSVEDNGMGIDLKFSDRIFQVFQRINVREESSGTGIGLAVCKRIAERHGGKIWLESVPDIGSTFYFSISKKI